MSSWRSIYHGLRALTHRSTVRNELDDEVRDYYERAHAQLVRDGLSPAEAQRELKRQLGDAELAREDLHSFGWEHAVSTLMLDTRLALRRLRNSPLFALIATATLALGIGAVTAIASTVGPILFSALPYPNAERIVMLSDKDPAGAPLDVTYGTFLEVAARSRSFDAVAAADRWRPALAGTEPEQIVGSLVTQDYFSLLGIAPTIGRTFSADEAAFGGPRVVVVSDAFAQRRFGGTAAALGATISLDGADFAVIGIMPGSFSDALTPAAEVWAPRQFRANAPFESTEWGHHMRMLGRLRTDVSIEQASDELAAIGAAPIEEFARPYWATFERGLLVEPLNAALTANTAPVLLVISGAVLLLLVIACANVANLLLARGIARRAEFAVRCSLGAPRMRLVRQLLTESLVLCTLGGVAGLAVAVLGVRAIVAMAPSDLPRLEEVGFDLPAFAFALSVTLVVALAVGLLPALSSTRLDLRIDLGSGTRAVGTHGALRRALVAIEVALALMLLIGAGVLLRSLDRLLDTDPGFTPDNLLTLQIVAVGYRDRSPEETAQYFRTVLDAVGAVPGVQDAALSSLLPLSGDFDSYGVQFARDGDTGNDAAVSASALRYAVAPQWFETMQIPLIRGRVPGAQDARGAPQAIVINESFAQRQFGDRSPIGERLRIGPDIGQADRPWGVIVGVAGDVRADSLALDPPNAFYVATDQWAWVDPVQTLVARTNIDPLAVLPDIRGAIWSVDATPPLTRIATMQELVTRSAAQRVFALRVFSIFAVAALGLAALGIYGIIAGSVAERTREIGLRAALGATRTRIVTMVMRQGMTIVLLGIAPGILGAALLARSLTSLLYQTAPLDPTTVALVIALLLGIAATACLLPAWRAARIEPTTALRIG